MVRIHRLEPTHLSKKICGQIISPPFFTKIFIRFHSHNRVRWVCLRDLWHHAATGNLHWNKAKWNSYSRFLSDSLSKMESASNGFYRERLCYYDYLEDHQVQPLSGGNLTGNWSLVTMEVVETRCARWYAQKFAQERVSALLRSKTQTRL